MLPKVEEYRRREQILPDASALESNMYVAEDSAGAPVRDYLLSRLDLPIHSVLTEQSVENTFAYLFHTLRCGIYVMIRGSKLVMFCPFANKNYTNNWKDRLKLDGDVGVETYYEAKATGDNYIPEMSK